ncbi:DUF4339 domain-containing protein [Cupriavidus sp. RAF12]|uniref:DUF4339 domain-containing protein n=1 Tax=Cupriavidus sp. RAF12 TaxID=3233050 RepID=UPI003F8EBC2F
MTVWHYEKNGERLGPVSETDIVRLVGDRAINSQTLVWQTGFHDWKPLSQTPLAMHLGNVSAPPVLPGHRINNGLVWTLAIAPILGLLLQGFVAGVAYGEFVSESQLNRFWWITLVLNVGLSLLDVRQLKKTGADVNQIERFAFLVPVYLWKRKTALQQSPAYFWVWIATFFLSLIVG